LVGSGEKDVCTAFAAPSTVAWIEDGGMGLDEIFLLDRSEFDHGELSVGVGEGGKDFSGYAEVRVVHVFALFGFREAESDAAEVGDGGWHEELLGRRGKMITQIDRGIYQPPLTHKGVEWSCNVRGVD